MNPRQGAELRRSARRSTTPDAKIVLGHRLAGGPRHRGRRGGARHPRAPSRDGAVHRAQARAPLRERRAAAGARRARRARRSARTDGDIRETVRTIVTSPEFFSRAAYRAKVKSPFELVASALRAIGARPDTTPRSAQLVALLGQPIFGHQAPERLAGDGRRVDEHGRDPQSHQLRARARGGPRARRAASRSGPRRRRLRSAPREQQVDAVILDVPRRPGVARHARRS